MKTVTFKDISNVEPGSNDWGIPEGIATDIRLLSEDSAFFDSVSREISRYELHRSLETSQVNLPDRKEHADDMIKAVNNLIRRFSVIEKYDPHNPKVRSEHSLMKEHWVNYRKRLDSVSGRITKQKAIRILAENLLPIFGEHELDDKLSGFIRFAVLQIPFDKKPPSKTLIKDTLQELRAS